MTASTTHGVTKREVKGDLPFAEGTIDANSQGLDDSDIDRWINGAAGSVNAILTAKGIDPTSLGGDVTETVRNAIFSWVEYKALKKRDYPQEKWESAKEDFDEKLETIRQLPEDLGTEQDPDDVLTDNVDTSSDKTDPQHGTNFGW